MKKSLFLLLCAALILGCAAPEKKTQEPAPQPEREDENGLAFAALSVINMREDPNYAAELGTQAR